MSKDTSDSAPTNEAVDPELKAIHFAAMSLYNRETAILQANRTSIDSINAINFLTGQATIFADSALFLMEDVRQPLNVPCALLRTCLEAQARANHIIAANGAKRENLAHELVELMHVSHEYYEKRVIQMGKNMIPNESKLLPRDRPYFAPLKKYLWKTDTSNLKKLKKQYDDINRKWNYGTVIERAKFGDPASLNRSEAQPLQPGLYLVYLQCCAFVHSDPASLKHQQLLTPVSVVHTIVLAEVISIFCFFVALGKEMDQDIINVKKRIIAFDVNEKVLPKKRLPRS